MVNYAVSYCAYVQMYDSKWKRPDLIAGAFERGILLSNEENIVFNRKPETNNRKLLIRQIQQETDGKVGIPVKYKLLGARGIVNGLVNIQARFGLGIFQFVFVRII